MGIIGRSFVIASLAVGTLVAGFVVGTEGSENEKGVDTANALHIAMSKPVPMLMQGDGGTTLANTKLAGR